MDLGENVLLKLCVPTCEVTTLILQDVLSLSRKEKVKDENTEKLLNKLWEHIMRKLPEFDDQLLCSTCFYTLLTYSKNQDIHLFNVIGILDSIEESYKDNDIYVITLMYGLFQSSYLTQKNKECTQLMERIMKVTFKLLMQEAYKYSQYTFIAFKTITSFKKVIGTSFQDSIFNRNNQITLLNVINHNWENPITGVRNLIRNIFNTLISMLDKDIYICLMKDINLFYWNKAKFLMLTEIIEQSQKPIYGLLNENQCLHGLIYSLHKPGLVSCGSDMYYAILKKVNSDEEWCKIFLKDLCIIFNGTHKAIENFYNYWCLITLKKFPTLLGKLLFVILKEKSESSLLSALNLVKQGNKLALNIKEMETKEIIEQGLVHSNPQIRIKAFDIICVCHGKCLPDRVSYNTILEFLCNNINSDCSVLRIHMINSFSSFLTHLYSTFLMNQDIEELKHFFLNLQNLLKTSINFDGNYQRKITTIKLIDISFKHLNGVQQKKSSGQCSQTLIEMLRNQNMWILSSKDFILKLLSLLKDPADDVRQSVLHVLLNYYSNDLKSELMFNYMIEDVIKCKESKFFYDIDCGKIIFKLLISILLKENIDAKFTGVKEYFKLWYDELTNEIDLKRNIVDSINDGKQLHSILGLLLVIFECCLQYKYKLDLPNTLLLKIVDVLEKISNQFMFEESTSVSYDFSKMNDLVESLIEKSSTSIKNDDETKISGLHQVVLNCLWLNVKMSCDISASLIMYVEDEAISNKCLSIIVHVLETCRHKGAIEAAGSALGKSIQYLTSLPSHSNKSKLPMILLERKLKELILEAQMASVTRRGAGLSIMVHRIVASDKNKGKPLFHYFMNIWLEACMDMVEGTNDYYQDDKDLPKAINIHFLTRIVMDSSLASETMFYSAKLAELAFNNLKSSHWQIRNAALQLYGALVPKLIGQKKASGIDDETVSTVACDEFRTHSPKLWAFIVNQLENTHHNFVCHSDLVPILNILASVARRYHFSCDTKEILDFHTLEVLLGSKIYTVRRLASNCILNIYSFQDIYTFLMSYDKITENSLHGTMILVEGVLKLYKSELSKEKFCELQVKFRCIFRKRLSYLSRTIFDNIFFDEDQNMSEVIFEARNNKYVPGVYLWANNRIRILIETSTWQEIADNLHYLLIFDDFEEHSQHLCRKLAKNDNIPEETLINIANKIIISEISQNSCGVWIFLFKLSKVLNYNYCTNFQSSPIKDLLNGTESLYKIRYLIPFAARVLSNSNDYIILSKIVYNFCSPNQDPDMRYIAALANNEIAQKFNNLSDDVKMTSIISAIILLQDEDEDIRNTGTTFYENLTKENKHAFICLNKILSKEFMDSVLNDPKQGVKHIISHLNNLFEVIIEKDNYNPFSNDSKNIYLEDNFMKKLLHNLSKKYE